MDTLAEKKENQKKKKSRKDGKNGEKFNIKSLGIKIALMMILVSVISLAIIGVINYRQSYDALKSELVTSSTQMIDFVDLSVDNYLEGIEKQARVLSLNSFLLDTYYNPDDEGLVDIVLGELSEMNVVEENILTAYFVMEDKRAIIYPDPELENYDPTSRDWYRGAVEKGGEVHWSDPYEDAFTGETIITASKIVTDNGKLVGAVALDIDIQDFSTSLSEAKVGDGGYIYILDNSGILIVHPSSEYVGTDIMTNSLIWESAQGQDIGFVEYEFENAERFSSFTKNARTGWTIGSSIPESELTNATNPLIISTVSMIMGAAVIIIIISTILSKKISENASKLQEAFKEAAAGDFTIELDIRSKDEFGLIGNDFNKMIEKLRGLIGQVKESSFTVGETSDSILEMTRETDMAMNEVSETIQEVAKGNQEQAMDIDNNSGYINDLASALDNAYNSIIEANDLATETEKLGNEGLGEVEILIDRTERSNTESNNLDHI